MAHNRYVPLKQVPEQPGYEWTSERMLRRLVYERRIPYSKPANRVLINLNDLDAMVEESRVEPLGA
ncbi:MAG: excisionase [Acidobacteria bacterium]|nr:excisionase [Acidobacteriota bacterium]